MQVRRLLGKFPPTMLTFALMLSQLPAEPFLKMPDIHGEKVVFVCEGDLWVGSLATKEAKRLTRHTGPELYPRFSPDGKTIAYTANYEGLPEVFTIPVTGGTPTRVTYRNDYAHIQGWSSDGKTLLFRSRSVPRSFGLYTTGLKAGPEGKLPIEFASHGVFGPTENDVAFTRFNRFDDAWFHYDGGMQNQIWVGNISARKFKQVTNQPGTNEFPAWEAGNIYFANERQAKFTLFSVPASGGGVKKVAGPYPFEIREVSSGPGAVIYEKGRGIEMVDLKTGKAQELRFELDSDLQHTRTYSVAAQDYAFDLSLSPTGKRVYVESRGQIVSIPAGDGEARIWKAQVGARLRMPRPSPDGKTVAYLSDQTGEQQIWLADADGSNARMLTSGAKRQILALSWSPNSKKLCYYESGMKTILVDIDSKAETVICHTGHHTWDGVPVSFSPDSKFLAYSVDDGVTNFSHIQIRNLETGEVRNVGHDFTDEDSPDFSSDGKYLAVVSRKSFTTSNDPILNQLNMGPTGMVCLYLLNKDVENPLQIKDTVEGGSRGPGGGAGEGAKTSQIGWNGLDQRQIVLPMPPGNYGAVSFAGSRLVTSTDGNIVFFDIPSKSGGVLTPGRGFEVSADERKILVGDRVVDAMARELPPTVGKFSYGGLRLTVEPRDEWKQIFWDAWRLLRDFFYVENMHGNDWNAIGKKYSDLLPSVRSRDELDDLIRWMQAEIGSSHQYLSPGDEQSLRGPLPGAFLGIDVVGDSGSKRLKITKLMRGDGVSPNERSPLLEPGFDVKEGDYLWAIGGNELNDQSNYRAYLQGRAGQTVGVTIASKADGSDKRTLFVKPVANETRMRLIEWVAANRRYVSEKSGGKIGYLYVQAMGNQDVADFVRQFFPQRHKQALIVDVRFNNGGYTQTMINNILQTKLSGHFNQRGRPTPWTRQTDYFAGPLACVINEFAVSCGEEFPSRFRDLKLGPLVGRRTYGGEVGSSPGWPLVDGGVISVSNYGMFSPDGKWVIEGEGVSPDFDVESDPNVFAAGGDAQLDKTIEILMAQITKKPTTWPQPPADRVRVKPSGGG